MSDEIRITQVQTVYTHLDRGDARSLLVDAQCCTEEEFDAMSESDIVEALRDADSSEFLMDLQEFIDDHGQVDSDPMTFAYKSVNPHTFMTHWV